MISGSRPRLARLIVSNLIAAAIALVLAFATLEVFCRTRLDDGMRYEFEMWRYSRALKVPSDDPEISFTHRSHGRARIMGADVALNGQGLRDPREFAIPKPAGVTRIMMLGDSVTFGFGVPGDQTTSHVLEGLLNERGGGPTFEVLNAGVGNYNTTMEVASYAANGRRFAPNVVLLNFFVNDAEATPPARSNLLTRHSLAAVYLNNRYDSASRWAHGAPGWQQYYLGLYQPDAEGWRRAQAAIANLKRLCGEDGAAFGLVNYPDLHQTRDYPLRAIDRAVHGFADSLGIPTLDLLPAVEGSDDPSRLWVHISDPHPNGGVHRRYASMIADWLQATGLVTFPRATQTK